MSNFYTDILMMLFLTVLCLLGAAYIGSILVRNGIIAADRWKRGISAIAVFVILVFMVYLDAGYVSDVHFLAAVIGAGCCWIGSNKR